MSAPNVWDPSAENRFAYIASRLNAIAREVLAAQARGDYATARAKKAEYDAILGRLTPVQKKAAKAAAESDLPPGWMLWLLEIQKYLKLIAAVLLVGVAVYLWKKGRK